MSRSTNPTFIPVTYSRPRPFVALLLVASTLALASCGDPRPSSLNSTDAGVPDPINPGCSDPKTCGEPKLQGQPDSTDAGVPSPLDPGCSDPKTCGEPRSSRQSQHRPKFPGPPQPRSLDSTDAGVPSPLDPGCSDPKTCGEPLRPTVPSNSSH
jgi:hypothetical protein